MNEQLSFKILNKLYNTIKSMDLLRHPSKSYFILTKIAQPRYNLG